MQYFFKKYFGLTDVQFSTLQHLDCFFGRPRFFFDYLLKKTLLTVGVVQRYENFVDTLQEAIDCARTLIQGTMKDVSISLIRFTLVNIRKKLD